jgi:hypothetical protein
MTAEEDVDDGYRQRRQRRERELQRELNTVAEISRGEPGDAEVEHTLLDGMRHPKAR